MSWDLKMKNFSLREHPWLSTFLLTFLWGIISFVSRSAAFADETSVSRMRPMLGTYVEITVQGLELGAANRAIESAFAAIEEVDRCLSSHRPDSELNAINAAAGTRAIAVSPWTYECIALALKTGEESDGAFDITCRPILDLWGFVRKERYHLPTQHEIDLVLPLVNYRNVLLLKNNFSAQGILQPPYELGQYRVGLLRSGMKLDVGGIGKGFAADKAVETLKAAGVTMGLVHVGGDLRGFGLRKWKVGIANPSDPHKTLARLDIQDEAVSTSGNYENFFEVNGHRYTHIINPKTGWPVHRFHSFSVRAPEGVLADAWSTALFVNPKMKPPTSVRVVDIR